MLYAVMKYIVPFGAGLAIGPVACWFTMRIMGPDGGDQASLLMSASPSQGLIAALAVFALAAAWGCLGARTVGTRSGLFAAGLILAWAAWGTGRSDWIIERIMKGGLGGSPLATFAIEGVLVGALGILTAVLITRVPTMAGAIPENRDPEHAHHHLPKEPTTLLDSTTPAAIAAALIAGAIVVWIIAQETLKGQTFAAAAIAGIAAAAAGRMASQRVSGAVFIAGLAVVGAAGPAIAMFVHSTPEGAVHAAQAGKLFALARALPLDYMAGAFVGVPMGLVWAGSMIERHHPQPATKK
jgi:hypothetical protein